MRAMMAALSLRAVSDGLTTARARISLKAAEVAP